jgi:hypothetical protein
MTVWNNRDRVNCVWKTIFEHKRERERGTRKLHNEELLDLYSSPNIIRMIKIKEDGVGGTFKFHGALEKYIRNLRRETRRERTTWKTGGCRGDDIRTYLGETD